MLSLRCSSGDLKKRPVTLNEINRLSLLTLSPIKKNLLKINKPPRGIKKYVYFRHLSARSSWQVDCRNDMKVVNVLNFHGSPIAWW